MKRSFVKVSIKAVNIWLRELYCVARDLVNMTRTVPTDRIFAIRTSLHAQRWLGLWKWQNEDGHGIWSLLKRCYPYALHLPITFTFVALMWFELVSANNLEQAGDVLYMSLTLLAWLIKLINMWHRREQAWQYINVLDQSEIFDLHTTEELLFWQRGQHHFKRIFYTYYVTCFTVATTGYLSVFYQDSYELPFSYYVPFEWRNPQNYFYAWGYNVLAMSICCATYALLDTMGCYFMFQIALLYRLLSLRLLALHRAPEHEALPALRRIFELHKQVRLLTRQCEILVSPYVLSKVVLSALIICFSGYRLVQMDWQSNPGLFLTTLLFAAVMIVQMFLPCYYGNQLTVQANQLTDSVFNTNWLEYSVGTRKLLNCYMEFLKRPVKVRAGVFFEIGLPIFMKTINNAYSFFALLLNLSK